MQMRFENCFLTKDGKRKRLSANRKPFQSFMEKLLKNEKLSTIDMIAATRREFNLGLSDAISFLVFQIGIFNNAELIRVDWFNNKHFKTGEKISSNLANTLQLQTQ